jgi:putative oxidoreductase
MRILVPIGRVLFALIFLTAALGDFSQQTIGYAAASGVPMANVAVPVAGILSLLGALSIALGYKTKVGAWLIVLFLVPVTFAMHKFWGISDPMMKQMQMVNFMKNMGLLGAALLIAYFGAGPISIDNRGREAV